MMLLKKEIILLHFNLKKKTIISNEDFNIEFIKYFFSKKNEDNFL